jgi:hypothetical protein
MNDPKKYNGWANHPTYQVGLDLFDELPLGLDKERVAPEECREYAESVVRDGADGFALEYALSFLDQVDWRQIADHVNGE